MELMRSKTDMTKLAQFFTQLSEPFLFLNIGTPKCVGDSFGPRLGTLLEESHTVPVFGTVEAPVHALNLKETYTQVQKEYPNYQIIAADSCLGPMSTIGDIVLRSGSVKPGEGVGKDLSSVGDYNIQALVAAGTPNNAMNMCILTFGTKSNLIQGMAEMVAAAVETGIRQRACIKPTDSGILRLQEEGGTWNTRQRDSA